MVRSSDGSALEIELEREKQARIICAELNNFTDLELMLAAVVNHIKKLTTCEAVGIRLQEDDICPFYAYDSSSDLFIKQEDRLCDRDNGGRRIPVQNGADYLLECMCGNILRGRFDPSLPFFTDGGSFWSNNTAALPGKSMTAERQSGNWNVCNLVDYQSAALIPIKERGEPVGLIQINDRQAGRFTPELISLLEMIGGQIGLAVKNSQIHSRLKQQEHQMRVLQERLIANNQKLKAALKIIEDDLEVAAEVQHSLLPQPDVRLNGVEACWWFEPCGKVSGDLLNVVQLDEWHVGFYLLDVSGHGIQASLLAVTLNHLLSNWRDAGNLLVDTSGRVRPPAKVIESLNMRFRTEADSPQFFTIIYGILNTEDRKLRYVRGGHQPLLIQAPDGKPEYCRKGNRPIGWRLKEKFTEIERDLVPGTRLVLFSDGIIEAGNRVKGEMFGYKRLSGLVQSGAASDLKPCVDGIVEGFHQWLDGCPLDDDATLLALQLR